MEKPSQIGYCTSTTSSVCAEEKSGQGSAFFLFNYKVSDNTEKSPLQIPKSQNDIFILLGLFEQQVKDIKQKRSTLS